MSKKKKKETYCEIFKHCDVSISPKKNLMENPISSPVASFCPGCNVVLFQISLSTLVTLHNNYLRSKEVKNILERYSLMREMIKVSVIK